MTELLFEGYGVPSLAYGIDALFSAHHHWSHRGVQLRDALVVSSGHQTTHIIPLLDGRVDAGHCKRFVYLHVYTCTLYMHVLHAYISVKVNCCIMYVALKYLMLFVITTHCTSTLHIIILILHLSVCVYERKGHRKLFDPSLKSHFLCIAALRRYKSSRLKQLATALAKY